MKDFLLIQFELHHQLYNSVLDGFTDEETNRRLYNDTKINHIKYIAGHLLNAQYGLGALANVSLEVKWNNLFGVMGQSKAKDDIDYPPIEKIKAEWNGVYSDIRDDLKRLAPEVLDRKPPAPFDKVADTSGGLWAFINHHQAYHIGQIGLLRRGFGKEPMKYS